MTSFTTPKTKTSKSPLCPNAPIKKTTARRLNFSEQEMSELVENTKAAAKAIQAIIDLTHDDDETETWEYFFTKIDFETDGLMSDMDIFQDSSMTQWYDLSLQLARDPMVLYSSIEAIASAAIESTANFSCLEASELFCSLICLTDESITKILGDQKEPPVLMSSISNIGDIDELYTAIVMFGGVVDTMPTKIEGYLRRAKRLVC